MKKILFLFIIIFCVFGPSVAHAAEKIFTASDLSKYTGKDGMPAYYAYKGKVYDVSTSTLWKLGEHFGLQAGVDLTGKMDGAPHGDEVISRFPAIGVYQEATGEPVVSRAWYDAPIRVGGLSILAWTGIVLGIVFFFNFFTCFALPWSKLSVPWAGSRPGPDALDSAPVHMNIASIHKYFAWGTVVIGIIHGVIGFAQVFLKLYL